MQNQPRDIGIDVKAPAAACQDKNCPFHGSLRVHGRSFTGLVTSAKSARTVTVKFSWKRLVPKYERYQTRRTSVKAHSPPCLNPQEGATVTVMETRPLSKTKNFVVVEIVEAPTPTITDPLAQEATAHAQRQEKVGAPKPRQK